MTIEHRRVLIVDDDHDVRRILAESLRQKPLTVDVAEDGQQAVDLLRQHSYSVILLDLLMPGMNGFAVLDVIDENAAHAPVVLVVSGAPRSVLVKLDSRKIHGVVRKPFIPQDVADIVAACTEIRTRGTFETMALATVMTGAPLIALLKL